MSLYGVKELVLHSFVLALDKDSETIHKVTRKKNPNNKKYPLIEVTRYIKAEEDEDVTLTLESINAQVFTIKEIEALN